MHSPAPDTEVFSTPPTTPMNNTHNGAHLTPSLSRKSSRPSSLRIAENGDWRPDVIVTDGPSPVNGTTNTGTNSGKPLVSPAPLTPRVGGQTIEVDNRGVQGGGVAAAAAAVTGAAASPRMHVAASASAAAVTGHHSLKSPYFVHSHLDRGASFQDWLRMCDELPGQSPLSRDSRMPDEEGEDGPEVFEPEDEDEEEQQRRSLTKQLAETAAGVREMSKQLGRARIQSNIRNILIVTKAKDNRLIKLTRELALYLMQKRPKGQSRGYVVYVDSQLRTSRRFDAAGLAQEYPELFAPFPRRQSMSVSSSHSGEGSHRGHGDGPNGHLESGQLRYWTNEMCHKSPHLFDFVVTLGGDGTVLYTSWLFQRIVPPVLPFALGSLGFLTNFDFVDHRAVMDAALDAGIRVNLRMRFTCTVYRAVNLEESRKPHRVGKNRKHRAVKKAETGEIMMRDVERGGWEAIESGVPEGYGGGVRDKEILCFTTRPAESFEILNDLVVDRGPSPYVSQLELFADEHHLTTVQADGLCIATPTGSTAYSLSAGGSLVHPEIPSMLITPLCPHTLSFRPMLLPDSMELRICVPFNSRSTAWASFDGRGRVELKQGDHIKVTASRFPFPTVCADRSSTDWFHSISRTLKWNERERQKSFVVVEDNSVRDIARRQTTPKASPVQPPDVDEELGPEDEEDEVSDEEEEDKYDIDVIEDGSPVPVNAQGGAMLQPSEAERGTEKTLEDARAAAAARAIARGSPVLEYGRPGGLHSGIDTPNRFLDTHHQQPHTGRHVAFSSGNSSSASSSSDETALHAPRAVHHAHHRPGDNTEREGLKTPTVVEAVRRLSAGQRRGRSLSREPRPRAFAVRGQDDSESESNISEDEGR